jgi:hypothetical protein
MSMRAGDIANEIKRGCDNRYASLFNYTIKDLHRISNKYNFIVPCGLNKNETCKYVYISLTIIEMKDIVVESLLACKKMLKTYQSTSHLKKIGAKNTEKLLPVIVQQILWLVERYEEYIDILKEKREKQLSKLIMLVSTIEGQCRQAGSIFSKYNVISVKRKKRWLLF